MRRSVKNIINVVITLILIIVGVSKLGYWVRPLDTDGAYQQIESFHSLPENSVEVIIYGSSYALRGLNTMELYDKYGIGAYNYAWHWQRISTTKTFVADSLLSQKPKLAVIETSHAGLVLEDRDINAEIFYTRYLHNREAVNKYLKKCFKGDSERYLSYYMPLCAFHDNWNSLTKQSISPLKVGDHYLQNMGFTPSDTITPITLPDSSKFQQEAFSESAVQELNEIVELCKQNDIEILFYTVPYEGEYCWGDAMEEYANENGYQYLNLFEYIEEIGIDEEKDFFDKGHLNTSGATKVANFLGKYIDEHYELTDMRRVEGNMWNRIK